MVVTIRLDGSAGDRVTARCSPLAELSACLHAVDDPRHHPGSAEWLRSALSDELAGQARAWSPLWGAFRARYLLPLVDGPERGLDQELADIDGLPLAAFVDMTAQALLGQSQRRSPDLAADGGATRSRFLGRLNVISEGHLDLGRRLLADPEDVRARLLVFLETVGSSVFDAEWARLRPRLDADAVERSRSRRTLGAAVIGGFPIATLRDDPPRVEFDKLYHATASLADAPCVLVPSAHIDPHTIIKHHPAFPIVIQYPVAPSPPQSTASLDLMRARFGVLADDTRVRLCRYMLRRPETTSDLAARMHMTRPQISRHLRRLREVGLVTGERHGAMVRYRLNTGAFHALGPDLLAALSR
ncbi:DUF5937 family protein [Nocardiopsis mangrovi]|uniref:DUF5937 family protein n=1 Tax=Nocardiopsis mangrovi TaxID=1179818 RepID=A0ABV9DTX7_9ACTN